MDIDLLSRMIGELIVENDQVGLPGVGTFVAEVAPASFSNRGYTINPPYRRISFQSQYLGDTLLADFYAQQNNIDNETARTFMAQFLKDMADILRDKKMIILPGLGRLRATKENNFFFIQDEESNIFPEGFALKPVSLKSHVDSENQVKLSIPLSVKAPAEPLVEEPVIIEEGPSQGPAAVADEIVVDVPEQEILIEEAPAVTATPADVAKPAPAAAPAPAPAAPASVNPAPSAEPAPAAIAVPVPEKPREKPQEKLQVNSMSSSVARIAEEVRKEEGSLFISHAQPKKKRNRPHVWKGVLIGLAAVLGALLIFVVVARLAPDLVDLILYSPEELRIINY